jgi:hypothetical protein
MKDKFSGMEYSANKSSLKKSKVLNNPFLKVNSPINTNLFVYLPNIV